MATCKGCVHFDVCDALDRMNGIPKPGPIHCGFFKDKADVVEVVRCRDCDVPHNKWTGCPNLNGLIPPPDFYCARGVRKEQDNG